MKEYHPNLAVRALTGLVSIAYFGLLILGVIVLIALPTVKLAAGDNPDWEVGLTVPVTPIDGDATVVTRWGDARLELGDSRASLRLPIGTLPWSLFALLWTYVTAVGALMLMFLHHLRRVLERTRGGMPFDAINALRLRWLGLLALAIAAVTGVSEFVTSMIVRGGLISERVEVPVAFSIDGWVVFFGFVLLVLAEVFRRGAELEEDQALTL